MGLFVAVSSILSGLAIMVIFFKGYTELISPPDKLILFFGYILLAVTGIVGIGFVVERFYCFIEAKIAAKIKKNAEQDKCLGEIEKLIVKINEDKTDREKNAALTWKSKMKEFIAKISYVILSLALLLGSSYALVFLFGYGLSLWVFNAVIFIGGTGVLLGLFYSVENIKALLGQGRAGFSFGVGNGQIKTLESKERLALIQLADRLYFRNYVQKIQPSFIGAIRNLGTFKGIILTAAGALIAYSFPGTDNWYILAGAIFGLILPYLVSVTYNFFCSYMNHYKFRGEFVKEYLKNNKAQEELRSKAGQLVFGSKLFFPFKNLWYGFSLRFPVTGSIIIFALARGQMIFWGLVVAQAIMPFMIGIQAAGFSIFEISASFFGFIGWRTGFDLSFTLIDVFNKLGLAHTIGDFLRLAIIVCGLRVPLLFYGKGSLSGFWTDFAHLFILNFEIGIVLEGGQMVSQHPQLHIIGKPINNVAQSLEGKYGAISWGSFILDDATRLTGINFSQVLHNILGGKEDVYAWDNAYFLYRTMKFEPALVGRMKIDGPELKLLLNELEAYRGSDYTYRIKLFTIFLIGDRGYNGVQDTLIRILDESDREATNITAATLGKVGDYKAVEPLMKKLHSGYSEEVARALLAINDPQATDIYIEGLGDKWWTVRTVSALWLAKTKDPKAIPALLEAFENEKDVSYNPSLKSIEDIYEQDHLLQISPIFAEAFALVSMDDIELVNKIIRSNKSTQKAGGIVALGLLDNPRAIKPLLWFLKDYSWSAHADLAALALGNFPTPEVKEALYSTLNDKDEIFRTKLKASHSLIKMGEEVPENFISQLIDAIEKEDVVVGRHEVHYENGGYTKSLYSGFPGIETKKEVGEILNKIKNSQSASPEIEKNSSKALSTESLLVNLKNESMENRYTAFNSLTDRLNEPIVKDAFINLIKYDNDPFIRKQALVNVAGMDDAKIRDVLVFALDDPHPQAKSAAILSVAPWADSRTMEKIRPFLDDPNLEVSQAAVLSMGARLPDFPKNIDYLLPKLNSDRWQIRQTTLSVLGTNINKFPQLKDPFLKIVKDNAEPFIFKQSALVPLSKIQAPEIKDLLVSNLNHPDWRMRQISALGLGNFNEPNIIPSLKPLLDDKQWQVRQATVDTFSKFNEPQTIDLLIPKLKDTSLEVRQASILPLASNLKSFPELKQPLMNTFQDRSENLWVRQIAGASLKNAGYSVGFDLEGIKPLEKSMVIFMPGLDNPNPFDAGRPQGQDWLKNNKIGQDFYRLEKIGLFEIDKSGWSGNIQDMGKAGRDFSKKMEIDYSKARNSKMDSVTFIGHSAGGLYSDEGINYFKTLDDAYMQLHPSEERIKINILIGGSPLVQNDMVFRQIAKDTGGQYKPVWSLIDPLSWPVAFKPNSQMILSLHQDYFNNLEFRQIALAMPIGRDMPISYSRVASGSISDQYFSATYKIQQIKSVYPSGITSYKTQTWYNYRSGQELTTSNLFNRINPLPPMQPIRQAPSYSPPSLPARGRI